MVAADPARSAREAGLAIGHEVMLGRANLGLTCRGAARLAGVAPSTIRRIERGDPAVQLDTLFRVVHALGLKLWTRVYPRGDMSLRDTGQLRIASWLQSAVPSSIGVELEVPVGGGRAIDMAFFSASEIVAVEIERLLADFQAQYRAADAKRDALAGEHARPVRLVIVVLDTHRNRRVVAAHLRLIRTALPAGSREILAALRGGRPIGRDGLLWVRVPADGR